MKKFLIVALLLFIVCSAVVIPVQAEETKNLSGYGFATCSSYENENRVAMYAIDGVIQEGSRWRSTQTVRLDDATGLYMNARGRSSWLAVEFEIETTISSAKIYWSQERAAQGYYTLQYSSDGKDWTDISDANYGARTGNGNWQDPFLDEITFSPVTAKFFRVESFAGETEEGLGSIYELELYGDPAQYAYLNPNQGDETSATDDQECANPGNDTSSDSQSADGLNPVLIVVIVAGVLCVLGIVVFTVVQLKKPGNGGAK